MFANVSVSEGRRTVMDNAIKFRALAADSCWNYSALSDAYLSSLSEKNKDQLVSIDIPDKLDSIIALKHNIDKPIQDRERETANLFPVMFQTSSPPTQENRTTFIPTFQNQNWGSTMQADAGWKNTSVVEEQAQRIREGLCL